MPAPPSEEVVRNEVVILDCLKQISENNTPLSLTIRNDESGNIFHSRIQSINKKKRQLVLKQVLPSDWREKITPKCKLEIKSYMNMGNIRFYGLLSALEKTENSPYCKLTLPRKVFRIQRRDYYRVSLAKIPSSVTLKLHDETILTGSCRDISMSGAKIALPLRSSAIEVGQILDECTISIDGILQLKFKGKVLTVTQEESNILVGIQFLDLSPAQLKPISSALNKIERLNINP